MLDEMAGDDPIRRCRFMLHTGGETLLSSSSTDPLAAQQPNLQFHPTPQTQLKRSKLFVCFHANAATSSMLQLFGSDESEKSDRLIIRFAATATL